MVFVKITTYSPYGNERYYHEIFPDATPDEEIQDIAQCYLIEDIATFWEMSSAALDYEDDFNLFQEDCGFWLDFKDEDAFMEEVFLNE